MDNKHTASQEQLLRSSRPNYGTATSSGTSPNAWNTSTAPFLENGQRAAHSVVKPEEEEGHMRLKQIIASFAIILSAGAKIAHEVIHTWRT